MRRIAIKYNGRIVPLGAGRLRAGRSNVCDIVLTGSSASRVHAFLRSADGQLHVADNDSKNGTWVNGARVTEEITLGDGDQLRLGNNVLHVVVMDGPLRRQTPHATTLRDATRSHEEVTATIDNASVVDLAEVLVENCVEVERRGETARTVMRALDELLDRAGFGQARLDAGDAARVRAIADTLSGWWSDGSLRSWRTDVERRISAALRRSGAPDSS